MERVFGVTVYTTDTWNTAQDEIQKQRRTDGCQLERVIAEIMLWSDSMQPLASPCAGS